MIGRDEGDVGAETARLELRVLRDRVDGERNVAKLNLEEMTALICDYHAGSIVHFGFYIQIDMPARSSSMRTEARDRSKREKFIIPGVNALEKTKPAVLVMAGVIEDPLYGLVRA